MIDMKFPEKMTLCESILKKDDITFFDIIQINKLLFESPKKKTDIFNQMHRSYDEETILKILNYQKENKLTNTQVAYHFRLSRNSVAKWKKISAKYLIINR